MALSDLLINQSEINVDTRNWPILQKVTDYSRKVTADLAKLSYNPYISNIHALNSDTHTLRIQYEYTQKQCVVVAIEGMDIWYMVVTFVFGSF